MPALLEHIEREQKICCERGHRLAEGFVARFCSLTPTRSAAPSP